MVITSEGRGKHFISTQYCGVMGFIKISDYEKETLVVKKSQRVLKLHKPLRYGAVAKKRWRVAGVRRGRGINSPQPIWCAKHRGVRGAPGS